VIHHPEGFMPVIQVSEPGIKSTGRVSIWEAIELAFLALKFLKVTLF
jgi:hypothetical protein